MTVSEKSVQTTNDNNENEDSVGLKTFKLLATIPTYAGVKTFSSETNGDNPSVLCKYYLKTYSFFRFF